MSTMPLNEAAARSNEQPHAEPSTAPPAAQVPCGPAKRLALQRPHPYASSWWTEWNRGEQYWNSLQGDKTPPCTPAT
ncbi:hypothetical protein [Streptomyces sp. NPDC087297]|uniref:hypothetical protein n=1 Tax=Streptomyces sp. NPDC087297 TaxID=3365778 RepID=UPI00381ACB04